MLLAHRVLRSSLKARLTRTKIALLEIPRSILYECLLIGGVGLLPLTWFHGLPINTSDFAFPLDRYSYFSGIFSLWGDRWSTGFSNPLQLPNLLFAALTATTQFIGLDILSYEKILFYVWFAGSGLSAYVLSRVLRLARTARIATSLFYMMNPFSLILVWSIGQGMIQIEYAFLPLIVGLFLHGLLSVRGIRYALGSQVVWFAIGFLGPAADVELTLVYWVAILILLISFCVAEFVRRDFPRILRAARFTALSIAGFAFLNLFWLLPTLLQIHQYFDLYSGLSNVAFIPNLDVYRQNSVQLSNALRLMGYWAFPSGRWEGGPYYAWSSLYSGWEMTIVTFVPLALIVIGIRKLPARVLLILPVYFIGLILIAGVNPPLGSAKEFIFVNFSLFQSTRAVTVVWGFLVALCSAPLLGFGVETVYHRIGKLTRRFASAAHANVLVVCLIMFLVVGVLVFPMWTGAIIQSGTSNFTAVDQTFEAPGYYNQFRSFIDSQPGDFRVLSLPLSLSGNGFYNWQHGYVGPDPLFWFSNHPVVYYNTRSPTLTLLAKGFAEDPLTSASLADLMALMNIRYIVVHDDAEWRLINSYESSYYHTTLSIIKQTLTAPEFRYVGDIGQLSIYENRVTGSHVYASVNPVILSDTFDQLRSIFPLGLFGPNSTIITGANTGPTSDVGPLTQILKLSQNGTRFFVPRNSTTRIYINSAEDLSQVFIDGTSWNLTGTHLNLIPFSTITACSPSGCKNVTATRNQATLPVNLSSGDQNINFDFQSFNFTGHNIEILMDGDGSGNKVVFQLYDSNGKFVGWNRVLNWKGPNLVDLPLNSYDYYSGFPMPNDFQSSLGKLLSIHYLPDTGATGQTAIVVRVIHPSSPSDNAWSGISGLNLTKGWHLLSVPQGQIGFGELVVSSVGFEGTTNQAQPPIVAFHRVSSTEYHVSVTNASNPFYLMFSESYDPGWKLFSSSLPTVRILSTPFVSDNHHFMANGFANAWYMDKTGTYDLTIYYYPQSTYDISLTVTVISLMVILLIVADVQHRVGSLLKRKPKTQANS